MLAGESHPPGHDARPGRRGHPNNSAALAQLSSGGLLVDHGWFRVLGGGCTQLPDLAAGNDLGPPAAGAEPPPLLTAAFDVPGGRFAVNGGGLPDKAR